MRLTIATRHSGCVRFVLTYIYRGIFRSGCGFYLIKTFFLGLQIIIRKTWKNCPSSWVKLNLTLYVDCYTEPCAVVTMFITCLLRTGISAVLCSSFMKNTLHYFQLMLAAATLTSWGAAISVFKCFSFCLLPHLNHIPNSQAASSSSVDADLFKRWPKACRVP